MKPFKVIMWLGLVLPIVSGLVPGHGKATEFSFSADAANTILDLIDGTTVIATRSGKFFEIEGLWKNQKMRGKAAESLQEGIDELLELTELFETLPSGKAVPVGEAKEKVQRVKGIVESLHKMVRNGAGSEGQNILGPRMDELQEGLDDILEALTRRASSTMATPRETTTSPC